MSARHRRCRIERKRLITGPPPAVVRRLPPVPEPTTAEMIEDLKRRLWRLADLQVATVEAHSAAQVERRQRLALAAGTSALPRQAEAKPERRAARTVRPRFRSCP